jgi:hypothetical protein
VQIVGLRCKQEQYGEFLKTVRGAGHRMREL